MDESIIICISVAHVQLVRNLIAKNSSNIYFERYTNMNILHILRSINPDFHVPTMSKFLGSATASVIMAGSLTTYSQY